MRSGWRESQAISNAQVYYSSEEVALACGRALVNHWLTGRQLRQMGAEFFPPQTRSEK
jgi:hypothetical protein